MLENLARANGETDGETGGGGSTTTDSLMKKGNLPGYCVILSYRYPQTEILLNQNPLWAERLDQVL